MSKIGYLSLSVLSVALAAPMSWGSYITSFEAPTFTVGQRPNKDSWTASNTAPTPIVTTSEHSDGLQSVLIPKNTSANSGITRIFSDAETTSADNGLTVDFMPGSGSPADKSVAWFYVFSDDGYTQFHLYNAASAETTPRVYWYNSQTATWSNTFVTNDTWVNEQWNTLQVKLDAAHHTLDVSINGTDIFTAPIADGATRFDRFYVFEDNNNDLYIDNLKVEPVPEPASFALVGLGGAMMLMRRRRKS